MLFIWLAVALIITAGILISSSILNPVDAIKMQTIAFTGLVFFEGFNALNFRSFKHPLYKLKANKILLLAIVASFLLQIAIVQSAAMQPFFGTASLSLKEWLTIGGISASILVIGEIFKIVRLKNDNLQKMR
jgi:Ca2+-transporting ATPase